FENTFTDPITVTIAFQEMATGLGASSTYYSTISYSTYRNALKNDETSSSDVTAVNGLALGAANPVDGSHSVNVTDANLRALGLSGNPPPGDPDGTVSLNTSIMNLSRSSINSSKYDLLAVTEHEIDEVLGFGSALNGL